MHHTPPKLEVLEVMILTNLLQMPCLQNLLVYTNRRLTKLSDRYLLDKPTDDGALKVIDQYQGNSERSVSTLSGGETFLLSLALALSLSDMSSKNVALDSLFIDEGFGTRPVELREVIIIRCWHGWNIGSTPNFSIIGIGCQAVKFPIWIGL